MILTKNKSCCMKKSRHTTLRKRRVACRDAVSIPYAGGLPSAINNRYVSVSIIGSAGKHFSDDQWVKASHRGAMDEGS